MSDWLGNGCNLWRYRVPEVHGSGYGGNTERVGYVSPDEYERCRDAIDQRAMESRHNVINGGINK